MQTERPRLRAPDRRAAAAALAAAATAAVAAAVAGCAAPTTHGPVAPDGIEMTPVALVGGVVQTPTPTPGPSPTPRVNPTSVTPPPEPLNAAHNVGVSVYADGVGGVRMLALSPSGTDLFGTVPERNQIIVMPDRDRDGVADGVTVFDQGGLLNKPNGLAFHDGHLYVANTDGVVRYRYTDGDLAALEAPEFLVDLPGEGLNWDRSLLFGPDGEMYVAIGSSCDVCVETDIRRAAILRFEPEAGGTSLFAKGLRHPVGMAFEPLTGTLWATDAGRDGLGQDKPVEEINQIVPGADYGWPYCYGDQAHDNELRVGDDYCQGTFPPVIKLAPHSSPSGILFYASDSLTAFPAEYQGGMFVAQHGAIRKYLPTGYSIVFLPFEEGRPTGEVRSVVDGWLRPDTRRWGSPVDLVQTPDGALLVSDDGGGRVYRVYYYGPRPTATPITIP
ncbi:MAG: PQQ-dependent sugar dehydrogenase [Anaerolineae bacterium]